MRVIIILCCILLHTTSYAKIFNRTPKEVLPESYLVADTDGNILNQQNSDFVRPMASISKLMIALLSSEQDLNEELFIPAARKVQSSIPKKTKYMSRRDLLTLALVKSDNFAAQILCTNLPDCVQRMNNKAAELGMTKTHYSEPTGLNKENVSTAIDLAKLLVAASQITVITEESSKYTAEIYTRNGIIKIKNTNPLTSTLNIVLSKTGFTNPAGGCISVIIGNNEGRRIIVILGSRNIRTRIIETLSLYRSSLL